MEATDLVANARYVLNQIVTAAAEAEFELPDRQYVTVGGSVFDCEQVTVSAMGVNTGIVTPDSNPMDIIGQCDPVWNTRYELAIVVCAAERMQGRRGDTAPSVDAIEADATRISGACAVLVNAVEAITAGASGSVRAELQLGQPQGGLVAAVMTLNVNLWVV